MLRTFIGIALVYSCIQMLAVSSVGYVYFTDSHLLSQVGMNLAALCLSGIIVFTALLLFHIFAMICSCVIYVNIAGGAIYVVMCVLYIVYTGLGVSKHMEAYGEIWGTKEDVDANLQYEWNCCGWKIGRAHV